MGKETSERIQTSILNAAEKKALVWMAQRLPGWVTSDMLTYLGVAGAVICAVGFVLGNVNVNYLWISSLGLVVNWFGDSLDGTVARVRNTQRPVYGFFIDHTRLDVALLVLAGYLALSIYTYIGAILKGEFRLTYSSFGPTEFRLVVILINTLYMYTSWADNRFVLLNYEFGVFDVLAFAIAVFLFVAYFVQFTKDRSVLAEKDPLKVNNEK